MYRMASAMNALIGQLSGRAVHHPADELHDAEVALQRAQDVGDEDAITAADRRIGELFEQAREQRREEHRDAAATMRFSSGVRRPVRKRLPPAQQMDRLILQRTGRLR